MQSILDICEEQTSRYRRGSLAILSSRYFPLYRVLLHAAFLGDFSRSVDEETFTSRLTMAYETLADAISAGKVDLAMPVGSTEDALASVVRDLKRNRGYLSVGRSSSGVYEYRLTSDALRAFEAVDVLSSGTRNEFTGARIETVLREISRFESMLTGDVDAKVADIDAQIAALQEERQSVIDAGVVAPDVSKVRDELWNLSSLIESLPASVRSLADDVRNRGREFRAAVERGGAVSRELQNFNGDMLSMISDSDSGRAYLDAMRVLTDDNDLVSIEDRLLALEDAICDLGIDVQGVVSGKWSFIVSVCDEVAGAGRHNVHATTTVIKARSADLGSRSTKLIDGALRSFSGDAYAKQYSIPWGVTSIAPSWWFDSSVLVEQDVAGFDDEEQEARPIDFDTMRTLSGPRTEALLGELFCSGDSDTICVSEAFNSLSVSSRRFVEWGSLSAKLASLGFTRCGDAVWNLVDSADNVVSWVASDYTGSRDLLRDFAER